MDARNGSASRPRSIERHVANATSAATAGTHQMNHRGECDRHAQHGVAVLQMVAG
jgi:hypothetical protein